MGLRFEVCRMEGQGERWELEVEGREAIVTAGWRGGGVVILFLVLLVS